VHAHFFLNHSIVELISISSIGPQLVSNQVLCSPLTVRERTVLEIIVRGESLAVAKNLRLGAEVLLLVLREIIYSSLFLMQGAQVLVVV